ncbi:MAG: UbiA prenyltransferase family protein [candidate division Zixibacteria bacterium]|nr:UbiA prenyltransferase family protein [Candidatus Tariuqbacter arcticus]
MNSIVQPTFMGHFRIARIDHWFKSVFVLPGIIVALSLEPGRFNMELITRILIGLLAVCLTASSNYVLNEVMDAPFDRVHPTKKFRPVPSGKVNIPLAYVQWIFLMIAGVSVSLLISIQLAGTIALFWIMGCIYNITPLRTKEKPYLDVLTESINNPIRMLAGWYIVGVEALPITSLLVSYWMIGAYFMAIKRFAEYRAIDDPIRAEEYRNSFGFYDEKKLLVSIMFFASMAMLFFGAFIMRYRFELIVSFPFISLVMAIYLNLGFKTDSSVQQPEKLYRETLLMAAVIAATAVMILALFLDIPILHDIFEPSEFDASAF